MERIARANRPERRVEKKGRGWANLAQMAIQAMTCGSAPVDNMPVRPGQWCRVFGQESGFFGERLGIAEGWWAAA